MAFAVDSSNWNYYMQYISFSFLLFFLQVIVKCIGKKDVLSCSWTSLSQEEHEKLNIVARVSAGCQKVSCVPTELYLLRTLNHPNIVSVSTGKLWT